MLNRNERGAVWASEGAAASSNSTAPRATGGPNVFVCIESPGVETTTDAYADDTSAIAGPPLRHRRSPGRSAPPLVLPLSLFIFVTDRVRIVTGSTLCAPVGGADL